VGLDHHLFRRIDRCRPVRQQLGFQDPGQSRQRPAVVDATPYWEPYFGPLAVALYDSTEAYSAGELVYTTAGDGTNRVYVSLQSDNEDNPATATAYDATVTYQKNDVVTSSAIAYMSLIDLNTANTPASSRGLGIGHHLRRRQRRHRLRRRALHLGRRRQYRPRPGHRRRA
jgi:hypothetical protein